MYRYFILFCLIASQADAQSIAVSGGGGSIVTSGNGVSVAPKDTVKSPLKTLNETRLEDLEYRLDFLESTLKAATEKPAVSKPELVIHPKRKPRLYYQCIPNCSMCIRLEEDIAAGMFSDFDVVKEESTWSGLYPVIQWEEDGRRYYPTPHDGSRENRGYTRDVLKYLKRRLLKEPSVTVTQPKTEYVIQSSQPGRYSFYNGRTYDWENETYYKCSIRKCPMCIQLKAECDAYQSSPAYRSSRRQSNVIGPQAPSPKDVITEGVALLSPTLTPESVLWEPGCGDARVSIAAVQECIRKYGTGCKVFGTEIDPIKAEEARRRVLASGLSRWITINLDKDGNSCSDALEFDPVRHGCTHAYCYLDHFLLQEIADKLSSIQTVVCPGHECVGIGMRLAGQCWVKGV